MSRARIILLAIVSLNLMCLMSVAALSQDSKQSRKTDKQATAGEVVSAGNKAIEEDDWATAETNFREAMRLEPKQALWRIQLMIALGQQMKWKEAFKELDKLMQLEVVSWVLSVNEKLPEGKVAFVNTEMFRDDKLGILRYINAVKEKKKVNSVSEDIGAKLSDFAKKRNLALIYDISIFKGTSFATGKTIDVTSDFITFYNERYPK